MKAAVTNTEIARQLQRQAHELAQNYGNLYRVRAYRRAAHAILGLDRPVADLEKRELQVLPGIGDHLAATISHYARSGEWRTYEQLTSAGLAV
jgi:DNA polymerase (family X)